MPNLPELFTRQQLLDEFATQWDALMAVIDDASENNLLNCTDAAGWNVRDHLAHLGTWLQGVIGMIRDGQPQWAAMNVMEELWSTEDYDPMNETIRQQTIEWSVADTLAMLPERHDTMVEIVAGMSDKDLLKPANDFVPGAGEFAICYKIDGNGPHHYREHVPWISRILGKESEA
jgi:hypothetical protein